MRVSACPNCASLRLRMPNVGDGGILGYSTLISVVCEDCGLGGSPLVFDDEEEYQKFRGEVNEEARGAGEEMDVQGAAAADAEADLEEREALSPKERAFLEDAQKAGEPIRPWLSVVFISLIGAVLVAATPFALLAILGGGLTGSPLAIVFGLGLVLSAIQGWAFFRIARRMWIKAALG